MHITNIDTVLKCSAIITAGIMSRISDQNQPAWQYQQVFNDAFLAVTNTCCSNCIEIQEVQRDPSQED